MKQMEDKKRKMFGLREDVHVLRMTLDYEVEY